MASSEIIQQFISINNGFAARLYKEFLNYNKENFIISPLSTATILALLQSGGQDETAEEIRTVLHFPGHTEEIGQFLHDLKHAEICPLQSAIKLYVKENASIKEEFNINASSVYQSKTENINFANDKEAEKRINTWLKEETNNKVQNLMDANSLDENTKSIIVNVSYLKSEWDHKFHIDDTTEADFYLSGGNAVKVDTMHFKPYYVRSYDTALCNRHPMLYTEVYIRQNHYYHQSEELKATFLELQFEGKKNSMVIVLPDDKEGLTALENEIDKVLSYSEYSIKRHDVNIALPKFKIDTETDFKQVLSGIGVNTIFSEETADLSKIAGDKGNVIINKIIQKAFITVNEDGVETGDLGSFEKNAANFRRQRKVEPAKDFIVDHPFIFYIKIKEAIIFVGRVTNPLL